MPSEERFQCLHPDPQKQAPRIALYKYQLVKEKLISALESHGGELPFRYLSGQIEALLSAEELKALGSIGWYTTVVKLDLEARGIIARVPGSQPQLVRLMRLE